jgi:carbon monoxide dehydrogenase subunit G
VIETEQNLVIAAGIDEVWTFARDMRRWADLMPGMREFTVIDEDDSRWTLKVGVGGLVRTVNVRVHVDEWTGPERVSFSYKLEGDPVEGGGSYLAARKGPGETAVTLAVRVVGGGPMAPMWEAMGRPVLPQLAKAFAAQLKAEIEKAAAAAKQEAPPPKPASACAALGAGLRQAWRSLSGRRPASAPARSR